MASVNLYMKFDYTDADGNLYSDGSTSSAKTISIDGGEIFDRTYVISSGGNPTRILDDDVIDNFDFLWIETDQVGEIQLLCNQGGSLSGNDIENGFVLKLNPGIPFILSNDASRNMGNMDAGFSESNYGDEIDSWEDDWIIDVIDRIEFYHTSGTDAKVRVFAIT